MKLICLITHGLGDWYPPLTILKSIMKKRNISDLEIYVDSIYFASPNFPLQQETGIKMIESITKNWIPVPPEYFGSGDWYGIPDRRLGPQYEDIKYDFLFYRLPQLQQYMNNILSQQKEKHIFLCGTGIWSYEWNGYENIPIDFSERHPLILGIPEEKEFLDSIIKEDNILIHMRKKGGGVSDSYFHELITYCNSKGKKTILLGLQNEVRIPIPENNYDLREKLSVEGVFYLIERNKYMITSSSVYTYHRFFFNLPTVITIMEHDVDRYHAFHKEDLENKNYIFYDSDLPHLENMKRNIDKWV